MTDRERLEQERAELEEQLIDARTEVDRLERERARVHDAIGALIGAPPVAPRVPVDTRPEGCACQWHSTCQAFMVCPACLSCALCAGHAEGCKGCPASYGATQAVDAERRESVSNVPAPAGRDRCPDALLPDGPTCPRCGGPRRAYTEVDTLKVPAHAWWAHYPAPESGL